METTKDLDAKPEVTVKTKPIRTKPKNPATRQLPPVIKVPPVAPWKNPLKPAARDLPHKNKRIVTCQRPEKISFEDPPSSMSRTWHCFRQIGPKFMILSGTISQSDKKFSHTSNDKQSAAISAVAIAYAQVYNIADWNSHTVDEIISIGDSLFKRSLGKYKHSSSIKPDELQPTFFVNDDKITLNIGSNKTTGDCTNTLQLQLTIDVALSAHKACIVSHCKKCFACWKDDNVFFLFNAHDSDLNGSPAAKRKGTSCVLCIRSIEALVTYLTLYMKPLCGKFAVYSVDLIEINKISKLPEIGVDILPVIDSQTEELKEFVTKDVAPKITVTEPVEIEEAKINITPKDVGEEQTVPSKLLANPLIVDFNDNFKQISETRGILRANEYLKDSVKAPCMNVAAIVMLRMSRALSWSPTVLTDILKLGDEIYQANLSNVEGIEVLTSDITTPIKFEEHQFFLKSEHTIFGKLLSTSSKLADLKIGLMEFFKTCDTGILQGPQSVAVWQEMGVYYMFDPKERDQNGQKWVDPLKKNCGDDETAGVACLTWFKNIDDLVNVYHNNVNVKHRQDLYRITKVEVFDYVDKSPDFNNWTGIALNKWIVRGTMSQKNSRFSNMSRNMQGTNTATVCIAYQSVYSSNDWNSTRLDKMLMAGDEHYIRSVLKLKSNRRYQQPLLHIDEIEPVVMIEGKQLELNICECVHWGSLVAQPSDDFVDLKSALQDFFKNYESGIIISCGTANAIWKENDFYYLYDSHRRDANGRNPNVDDPDVKTHHKGTACAMRFKKLNDFITHLSNLYVIVDSPEFNIHHVTVFNSQMDTKINHFDYKPIANDGAMLQPLNQLHEGVLKYESKSIHKTMCNCLMALAMNQIIPAQQWKRSDLNEIFKMGWQMFLNVKKVCDALDQPSIDWKLYADKVLIGVNKFMFDKHSTTCLFEAKEFAAASDEEIVERLSTFGSVKSELKVLSAGSAHSLLAASSTRESNLDYNSTDLKILLETWNDEPTKAAVLESDFFVIAIWKQHGMYFIFDPKACGEDGHLTFIRKKLLADKIMKRDRKRHVELTTPETDGEEKSAVDFEVVDGELKKFPRAYQAKTLHNLVSPHFSDHMVSEDEGCSCVIWFSSPLQLCEHILEHATEKYKHEECIIHEIQFDINFIDTQVEEQNIMWHQFKFIGSGRWMIRASLSQCDSIFSAENRNNQDVPNCIAALTVAQCCTLSNWNATLLDVVLKYGDRVYTKSIDNARKDDPQLLVLTNKRINPYQVVNTFTMLDYQITTDVVLHSYGDITLKHPSESVKNLNDAVNEFLSNSLWLGILEAKNYYVGIWQQDDSLFMFDPHTVGPDGKCKGNGMACLSRFDDINCLVSSYLGNLVYSNGTNYFNLYKVNITKTKLKPSNICAQSDSSLELDKIKYRIQIPSSYSAYQHDNDVRFLFGTMAENDVHSDSNGSYPPSACHAISALVLNKLHNVEFWTSKDIDEVLHLGMHLYRTTTFNHAGFTERLLPQHVVWNFEIANQLFVNVGMQLFAKGQIKLNEIDNLSLQTALEEFFQTFACGILTLPHQIVAVWKTCGQYFIYYSQACNKKNGMVAITMDDGAEDKINGNGQQQQSACLVSIAMLERLVEQIFSNIPSCYYNDVYELRKCTITIASSQQ